MYNKKQKFEWDWYDFLVLMFIILIIANIYYINANNKINTNFLEESNHNTEIEFFKTIKRNIPLGYPVKGAICSYFGVRNNPITQKKEFHYGIDIAAPKFTPIKVKADGVVDNIYRDKTSGLVLVIKHKWHKTLYAHLSKTNLEVGASVYVNDIIGLVGNSGIVTGTHLHYGIEVNCKKVDPLPYIRRCYE